MPSIEAQLATANNNFIQKLMEQAAVNSIPTTATRDAFLPFMAQNSTLSPNNSIPLSIFVPNSNNTNIPTNPLSYYGAYLQLQTYLNNNVSDVQQQCPVLGMPSSSPLSSESKSSPINGIIPEIPSQLNSEIFKHSLLQTQQDAIVAAMLAASTATSNVSTTEGLDNASNKLTYDTFDAHSLRHRLKRQTLSSQSLLSSLGNERSPSLQSEGAPSSSPSRTISSFNSLSSPTILADNIGNLNNADAILKTAVNFQAANNVMNNPFQLHAQQNRLNAIQNAAGVNCAGNDMLVPSNDKEGWCRNKKYIQIVKKGYRCTVCNKIYGRYNSVSYHVTIYHRNPPIRCDEEGCQFTTREARYIHFHKYYRHQIPLPESIDLASRQCPFVRCKHVSKSPAMLEKHMQRHVVDCLRDGIYECPECNESNNDGTFFKTPSYKAMFEHLRNFHSFVLTVNKSTEDIISAGESLSPLDAGSGASSSPELNRLPETVMNSASSTQNENAVDENLFRCDRRQQKRVTKSPPNYSCDMCSYRGRTTSNLEHHKSLKHSNYNKTSLKVSNKNIHNSEKLYDEKEMSTQATSISSPTDEVMEDLTNVSNNLSALHQQQQIQKMQEFQQRQLQTMALSNTINPFGNLNFTNFLKNNNNNTTPDNNSLANFPNFQFNNNSSNELLNKMKTNLISNNLNFIQQLQSSPDNLLQAVQQLLNAQNSMFTNTAT